MGTIYVDLKEFKMGQNWKPTNMILRAGDQIAIKMGFYLESKIARRGSEKLNDKTATIRETQLSYRVVNNWESVGLLDNKRPSGERWRDLCKLTQLGRESFLARRRPTHKRQNAQYRGDYPDSTSGRWRRDRPGHLS